MKESVNEAALRSRSIFALLIASVVISLSMTVSVRADSLGHFKGSVQAEWLTEDGRRMKLIEPFSFIDGNNKEWFVPTGTVVDGASIPRLFWNLIGPPFVGKYRQASVVHDYYCVVRTEPWKDVHRMFYHACLAGGVSRTKAKVMYWAVYVGGPRWKTVSFMSPSHGRYPASVEEKTLVSWTPQYDGESPEDVARWIEENDPSLSEIEAKAGPFLYGEPQDAVTLPFE